MKARAKSIKGARIRQIERSEWTLSWAAIAVTLLLTGGLASFALVMLSVRAALENNELTVTIWGLVGLVLIFDLYVVYQQQQLHRMRRKLIEREGIFELIGE